MKTILTILAATLLAFSSYGQSSFLGGKAAVTTLHAQTNYFIVVIGGGTNSPIRSLSPSNALEILKALPNWPVTGTNLTTLASGSGTFGAVQGSNGLSFGATGRYVWKADSGLGYLYDEIEGSAAISIEDGTSYVSINPSLGVVRSLTVGETNFVNVVKFVGGQVTANSILKTDGSTNVSNLTIGEGVIFDGTTLANRALINGADRLEFWDDFDRVVTNSPGTSPSGHVWGFATTGASGALTNYVYTQNGAFKVPTNSPNAAHYWGVTNKNASSVWNRFSGTFMFHQWPDANGHEDGLGLIVSTNLSFVGGTWLHIGFNPGGFYVQKEFGNYILNHSYPRGYLSRSNLHSFEINLVSNNIIVRVDDYVFSAYDSEIGSKYTPDAGRAVMIVEHNHQLTNLVAQYYGEWHSVGAGQIDPELVHQYGRSLVFTTNGALQQITASTGRVATVHFTGGLTASSLVRLTSGTNLGTVTIGSGLTFDGTELAATGGGGGEANVNGESSVTNATRVGIVNGKSGVTNLLRSLEAGYGLGLTNRGTNIDLAITDAELIEFSGISTNKIVTTNDNWLTLMSSNRVRVVAGTGGITVTPSGSGGVQSFTINDDDAGGSGSPGGTSGMIQFAEGSSFAGTNDFLFDRTQKVARIAVTGSGTGLGKFAVEWPSIGTNYLGATSLIGTNVGSQSLIVGVTIGGVHNGIQIGTNNVSPAGNTLSNHTDLGRVDLPWRDVYAENFKARQSLVMGTNGAATLTIRAPLMALDATNVIEPRIRIPVARQARVFYSVTGSGGVNTIIETNDFIAFTNGNNFLASGGVMVSNVFQWGVTNMGTNGSITVDWNGPRYARAQLNGDTTISFTNPPALGSPGRSMTLEIAHVGVSSAVTVQTIGPVGINWQSGTVILQNFTNKLYVEWNGTNFIGSSAQDTTSGSGAAALTNAPVLFNATLIGATTLATTTNQQAQHFLVETRLIPTNSALSNIVVNFATTNTVELWVTNNLTFTNWTGVSDSGSVPLLYLIRPQLIPRGVNWGNLGLSNPGYSVAIATNANNPLWTTLTNGKTYALTLTRVRTNIFPSLTLWE